MGVCGRDSNHLFRGDAGTVGRTGIIAIHHAPWIYLRFAILPFDGIHSNIDGLEARPSTWIFIWQSYIFCWSINEKKYGKEPRG